MISHPHDWIFVTGPKLGLHIYPSVQKNKKGGGEEKGREENREEDNNTPFVVIAHRENERRISPRANKKRLFLGPSPYDFTSTLLDFSTGGIYTINHCTFYVMSGQKNSSLHRFPTYYYSSSLVQNWIAFFCF